MGCNRPENTKPWTIFCRKPFQNKMSWNSNRSSRWIHGCTILHTASMVNRSVNCCQLPDVMFFRCCSTVLLHQLGYAGNIHNVWWPATNRCHVSDWNFDQSKAAVNCTTTCNCSSCQMIFTLWNIAVLEHIIQNVLVAMQSQLMILSWFTDTPTLNFLRCWTLLHLLPKSGKDIPMSPQHNFGAFQLPPTASGAACSPAADR